MSSTHLELNKVDRKAICCLVTILGGMIVGFYIVNSVIFH